MRRWLACSTSPLAETPPCLAASPPPTHKHHAHPKSIHMQLCARAAAHPPMHPPARRSAPPKPTVEEVPDEGLDVPLRLEKLANTVTHNRLKAALAALGGRGGTAGVAAPLVDVLFGRWAPKFATAAPAWVPVNSGVGRGQGWGNGRVAWARLYVCTGGCPGQRPAAVTFCCCRCPGRCFWQALFGVVLS